MSDLPVDELRKKLAAVLNEPLTADNMEAMAADHTKYVLDKMMPHIQAECNRAREHENELSLANFEPEYLTLASPRKRPNLTDIGLAHLKELEDRYKYHKNRIAELQQLNKEGE